MAPGAKFGRLGGNRALNNSNFVEQVFESGSSNNQVKIGQKLEKGYHGKLLGKLKKASKLLSLNDDTSEPQLVMPPLREIKVASGYQKDGDQNKFDPSFSPQAAAAQNRRDDAMEDQDALNFSDSAKEMIMRA